MECWASIIGSCDGGQSGEHYITKGLFSGKTLLVEGLRWCEGSRRQIPVANARANILCRKHNTALSRVDDEAIKLQGACEKLKRRIRYDKRGRLKSRTLRLELDGLLVSRWLAKTFCNLMAVEGRSINRSFVQHAFGNRPDSAVYTYGYTKIGESVKPIAGHITTGDYYDDSGNAVFVARIGGTVWALSTLDLHGSVGILPFYDIEISTAALLPNPREIALRRASPNGGTIIVCVIAFAW